MRKSDFGTSCELHRYKSRATQGVQDKHIEEFVKTLKSMEDQQVLKKLENMMDTTVANVSTNRNLAEQSH